MADALAPTATDDERRKDDGLAALDLRRVRGWRMH